MYREAHTPLKNIPGLDMKVNALAVPARITPPKVNAPFGPQYIENCRPAPSGTSKNFRQAPRSTSKMRAGREQIHRSLVIQRQLSISWRLAPCLIHASCVRACLQSKQG